MKLMKKSLLVLALTSMSLVGCGKEKGPATVDPNKEVTVVWWNNYEQPKISDKLTEEEARKKSAYTEYYFAKDAIEAFHAEHPNINITQEYKGTYNKIATAVKAGIGTGNIPTMVSTYQDNVANYIDEDVCYDMSAFGKQLEADADFNQNYLNIEKSIYGGKYYSLPYSKSGETLAINQTVFDLVGAGKAGTDTKDKKGDAAYTAPIAVASKTKYNVPENFYEMIEVARKMKADFPKTFANQKNDQGFFTAVPFCWDSAENMFITLLENAGIGYTDGTKKDTAAKHVWNNAKAKELMVQLKKWNNEGLIATQRQLPETDATNHDHEYSSNMVAGGKIFMAVSSTAGSSYFATDGGFVASMNHGLNWAKGSKAEDAKVISQGPSLTFLKNADEDVNLAAGEFYKFLTSKENTAKLCVAKNYFPLRASSYEVDSVKSYTDAATASVTADKSYSEKRNSYTGQSIKLNEKYTAKNNYFMSDVFVGSATTRTAVGGIVETVFNSTAVSDADITAAVEQAFNEAYTKITA